MQRACGESKLGVFGLQQGSSARLKELLELEWSGKRGQGGEQEPGTCVISVHLSDSPGRQEVLSSRFYG